MELKDLGRQEEWQGELLAFCSSQGWDPEVQVGCRRGWQLGSWVRVLAPGALWHPGTLRLPVT
jgi:hypothetical protein